MHYPIHVKLIQVTAMRKANPQKAKRHLEKLRNLVSRRKHPFSEMTEDEIIEALQPFQYTPYGYRGLL
jgi:hypothetical protein